MKSFFCCLLLLTFMSCASNDGTRKEPVEQQSEVSEDVAYGGNCGMGLCLKKQVKGDPKYNVEYKGKRYYFSSPEARDKFLSNIDANIETANREWERFSGVR